jgi:hypothetical protein
MNRIGYPVLYTHSFGTPRTHSRKDQYASKWGFVLELKQCLQDEKLRRSSSTRAVFSGAASSPELHFGETDLWVPFNFELRFGMKGVLRLANCHIWAYPCKIYGITERRPPSLTNSFLSLIWKAQARSVLKLTC